MNRRSLRYWSVVGSLGLLAALVLVRYVYLAFTPNQEAPLASDAVERGTIADRDGRVLAMDSPLYNIAVWRPETKRDAFPAEAGRLSSITGVPESEIMDRWSKGSSDFFYLAKRVGPQAARAVQDAKDSGAFSGVVVEKVEGRLYPEKRLASHLVGFVGDGNSGLAGIEKRGDDELLGSGRNFVLTIDADMQFSLEEIARKAMATTGAQAVILLAADARTGELLSYVAMPDFDPNDYASSSSESWYDWPSVYPYEPGSVFKVFTMASVLDLGGADDEFHVLLRRRLSQRRALGREDHHQMPRRPRGRSTSRRYSSYSCNAGAAYASDTVDPVDFYDKLRGFGFGSRTGLVVPARHPAFSARPRPGPSAPSRRSGWGRRYSCRRSR